VRGEQPFDAVPLLRIAGTRFGQVRGPAGRIGLSSAAAMIASSVMAGFREGATASNTKKQTEIGSRAAGSPGPLNVVPNAG
jgi:hypothetical protein